MRRKSNMTKDKGLTLTVVCFVQSANYGEGEGNTSFLKKFTRGTGEQYTYITRRALCYSLTKALKWDNTPVVAQGSGESQVVQYSPDATILDYPEIDLFGYMKTEKGSNGLKRSAVVRLSDAISLEPFAGDLDLLTNMGLAARGGFANSLAQSEEHLSLYSYTVAVDLDQVGVDGTLEVSNEEKAKRINQLLEGIEFLDRGIKARPESLMPLFVIGGVYDRKNPYFKDRVRMKKGRLLVNGLQELIQSYEDLQTHTRVGLVSDWFENEEEIREKLPVRTVAEFFNELRKEVRDYYVE